MDGDVACQHSEVRHADPVGHSVKGAVAHPQHIGVTQDLRPHVKLAELEQKIRFAPDGGAADLPQQLTYAFGHRFGVHQPVMRRGVGRFPEIVDKIELQAVDIVVIDKPQVRTDDIFPDLRVAHVQRAGVDIALLFVQKAVPETLECFGLKTRKGDGEPQYQLDTARVHVPHEAFEIRKFVRRRRPVAAFEVILCPFPLDLPAVVQDRRAEAEFCRFLQFLCQSGLIRGLVKAVPGGI